MMSVEHSLQFDPRKIARKYMLAGLLAFTLPNLAACKTNEVQATPHLPKPTRARNLCEYYGQGDTTLTVQIGINKGAIIQGIDDSEERIIPIRQAYNSDGTSIRGFVALKGDSSPFQNPPEIIPGDFRVMSPPIGNPSGPEQKQTVTITGKVKKLEVPNHPSQNTCVIHTK